MRLARRRGNRLQGRVLFMSASVPSKERSEEYRRVQDSQFQVEEAVVSLARAVFFEGGRLVFGGHPSISPLVALVAGEYLIPRAAEGGTDRPERETTEPAEPEAYPVILYQSRAYEKVLPDETWLLHRLGYADIQWTEALGGERYNPNLRGKPQCEKSLRHMRERMIQETQPIAMVCIGGMEGVEEEAELFRDLRGGKPIYVLERTGGAAAKIAHRADRPHEIRIPDRDLLSKIEAMRRKRPRDGEGEGEPEIVYPPYPLIVQTIVKELAEREGLAIA